MVGAEETICAPAYMPLGETASAAKARINSNMERYVRACETKRVEVMGGETPKREI